MALLFFIVVVAIPIISGSQIGPLSDIFGDQRSRILLILIISYCFIYPFVAFVKMKRHLNGSFEQNREFFDKAFETYNYVKTLDTPEKLVYRKKATAGKILQFYEDGITVLPQENPVIISGNRKFVLRIYRMIDQLLIKNQQ